MFRAEHQLPIAKAQPSHLVPVQAHHRPQPWLAEETDRMSPENSTDLLGVRHHRPVLLDDEAARGTLAGPSAQT